MFISLSELQAASGKTINRMDTHATLLLSAVRLHLWGLSLPLPNL